MTWSATSDFHNLRIAFEQARKTGVVNEFKGAYRTYRAGGEEVLESCWMALCDWDALGVEDYGVSK